MIENLEADKTILIATDEGQLIDNIRSERAESDTDKFWKNFQDCVNDLEINTSTIVQSDYDEKVSEIISTLQINPFNEYYTSEKDNRWLVRYEDIYGISKKDSTNIHLDSSTTIDDFLEQCSHISNFDTIDDFNGAFLYPSISSLQNIQTDGSEKGSILIKAGETLTIPIVFEYFLNNNDNSNTEITKSLLFDIKPNISQDDVHFHVEICGHNETNSSSQVYTIVDTVLQDETSTE